MRRKSLGILILLFIAFAITACSSDNSTKKYISKTLGIDLSGGTVAVNVDSHGGFHGDGITYVEITFSENDNKAIVEAIENNEDWRRLPLSENLNIVIYGKESSWESIGPYVTDDEGKTIFPMVYNGYYFFTDRHRESKDAKDDTDLLNRYSFNFTIAIYDTDGQTLHYCEFDT